MAIMFEEAKNFTFLLVAGAIPGDRAIIPSG